MANKDGYTVIGAGHGGKAMAAHLSLMGFATTLYNRTPDRIAAIKELSGLNLDSCEGCQRGFAKLACVTSNIAEALGGNEMIMVVVPSSAHADIARLCAPYLRDGQIIVLHPGRTCGAIEFSKVLRDQKCGADVTIAEAETFIYASRSDGPAQARFFWRQGSGTFGGATCHPHAPGVRPHPRGLPAVYRRWERAPDRVKQHGRDFSPRPDAA